MTVRNPNLDEEIIAYDKLQSDEINKIGEITNVGTGRMMYLGAKSYVYFVDVAIKGAGVLATHSTPLPTGYSYISSHLQIRNGGLFSTHYATISAVISYLAGNSIISSVYKTESAPVMPTTDSFNGMLTIYLEKK